MAEPIREVDTQSFLPSFKDDPLGRIGLILSNFSAGVAGRELPTTRLKREHEQQKLLDLKLFQTGVKAADEGVEQFIGRDLNDPKSAQAYSKYKAQFEQFIPGFGGIMDSALELAQTEGQQTLDGVVEHKDRIFKLCGLDQDCILDVAKNASLMEQFDETTDRENLPDIVDKFQAISEAVKTDPEGEAALAALAEKGFTVAELHQLPEGFKFTNSELRSIIRNEDIQNALLDFGFQPPGIARKAAEAEAVEGVKATKPAETNLAKLQRERGAAEAAGDTRRIDELNKKIKKEITIIGRTAEDVRTGLAGATPKDLDELRAGIRDLQGNLDELEKTRKAFEANPEAGGILGTIIENVGGVLGQIPFIGGDLEDMLPGDQEKVKKARTRARFLAGSMLTTITKEETGRFTDKERAIAEEALAALDPTASPRQIQSALETAMEIMTDSQNRKVDELFSVSGLDLAKNEGVEAFNKILLNNGFAQDQADNAILNLMDRRGIRLE